MERINLNQVRNFGDCITVTFNFFKQEFKPLLRTFVVLVLPLLLVDLFIKSFLLRDIMSFQGDVEPDVAQEMMWSTVGDLILTYFFSVLLYFWVFLFALAYVRVYQDILREDQVNVQEVWRVMWKNAGRALLWGIVYGLIVTVGCVFFIIPGIYLSILFLFSAYFLVLEHRSLPDSLGGSVELMQGKWWNFFGYVLLTSLIVGVISNIFAIPTSLLSVKFVISKQMPGPYEYAVVLFVANVGKCLMQVVSIWGIAARFYSYLEQKEHTSLLSKIEQLGNPNPASTE